MKKIAYYTSVLTIALFGLALYMGACKKDPCVTRHVVCKNDGTCKDGDCICKAGYEGDSCQFRVNEKFDSYYACIRTETIVSGGSMVPDDNDDTLRVRALNDKFKIQFYSVRDSIIEVIKGDVNGNYITIPEQQILNFKYYGTGSLNQRILTITLYSEEITSVTHPVYKRTYVGYKFE